jgi:hypothetical protein
MVENLINQINGRINLLAVFIGLIISILVLFVGALSFGGVVITGSYNVIIYILMVILAMVFFGSVVTGILGFNTFMMDF